MTRKQKLLDRVLTGRGDANIPFDDLCKLLRSLGFDERVRGSHHVFTKSGVEWLINLQRDGSDAKKYQVKQVRQAILEHDLELDE